VKKYEIGVVLGGGGARGFAHLGAIKALEEKNIKPEIISGTSAGAIVGALLADGKGAEEVFDLLKDRGFFKYTRISLPKTGLLKLEGLKKELERHLTVKDLSELKTPLFVGVTNISAGKTEHFNKGPISEIVLASASIPVLFAPVEINGSLYSDGGIMDNLPAKPLAGKCKKIIGINVSPVKEINKLNNLVNVSMRIFQLSVNATMINSKNSCDILIEPEGLEDFDIISTRHARKMFKLGYEYTSAMDI
jgi:NTE family protein